MCRVSPGGVRTPGSDRLTRSGVCPPPSSVAPDRAPNSPGVVRFGRDNYSPYVFGGRPTRRIRTPEPETPAVTHDKGVMPPPKFPEDRRHGDDCKPSVEDGRFPEWGRWAETWVTRRVSSPGRVPSRSSPPASRTRRDPLTTPRLHHYRGCRRTRTRGCVGGDPGETTSPRGWAQELVLVGGSNGTVVLESHGPGTSSSVHSELTSRDGTPRG